MKRNAWQPISVALVFFAPTILFERRCTTASVLRRTSATSPPYSQPLSPRRHGRTPSPSPHFSHHVPYHSLSASRRAPADGVTQRPHAHCCAPASVPRIRRLPIIAVCAHTLFCVRMTWQWHSAVPCGTVGRGLTKGQQQRVVCVCVGVWVWVWVCVTSWGRASCDTRAGGARVCRAHPCPHRVLQVIALETPGARPWQKLSKAIPPSRR